MSLLPPTRGGSFTHRSRRRSEFFSLPPDPRQWGFDLSPRIAESDDDLHNPSKQETIDTCSPRGFRNVGCLLIVSFGLLGLFVGYPVTTYFTKPTLSNQGGFNLGGINATGQIPSLTGGWGLIDADTPLEARTKPSWHDGSEMQLVFSDEFNVDGRSFYPGDDPYWEAVDLHYWGTANREWYDPGAVTTKDGNLVITLSRKETHNLQFEGGTNKFCFTGGYIETSVQLPGASNIQGLWPAVWTMGNLGRAGFGASLDGLWPYSYDSCDVGTLKNQTLNGLPHAATVNGDEKYGGALSWLSGQRLSRCTCPGESHPGPIHSDGTYVGRAAPEIDIFEAQIDRIEGGGYVSAVSQSAQWAPFNERYLWLTTPENLRIFNDSMSHLNVFVGNYVQQASSVVSKTDPRCYEKSGGCFSVYGFEYITWINDGKAAWTLMASGMIADSKVEIGPRPVPQEPMYIIANLGISEGFGFVDYENLPFPSHMLVDYIRVYQPVGAINVGCDPKDFPTQAYINRYLPAYTNPNKTTWGTVGNGSYGEPWPKNSFLGEC
ncbi:glycoside hydrolase family 16 protein [Infundibulicybe gibba]|nr:glycoside hydrolase family 16 protein [Infundibulicybe gibba]